jgi:hypothetical protein
MNPDQPVLGQKYRLIRQLEVGGMGSVWLAEHVQLSSLVAVKLIGREVAATPAGRERFLREARLAASLRSPNVVQILDYGLHEDMPFIVMELLEGESLAARLDREGRFPSWERAERVLRHVARAVGRAHAAGIIHRDLKPANIFLVRDEEEEIVKLLDFGIAKTTAAPLSAAPGSNTRTGEFLGSPAYASPEQLQVSKSLDHRADIWSLGVIAYECLIGRPPFADETLVGLVLAICMDPLPVPSRHGPVPPGFDAWFARACAREPEQRFPSVREASSELTRLVAAASGSSLPAPEPESAPAVQTPPSAPAATLLQGAFATPLPGRGGTAIVRRAEVTRAGGSAPQVQIVPRRSRAPLLVAFGLLAVVPLSLIAIRALASRALLDSNVLGLGAARSSQEAASEPSTSGIVATSAGAVPSEPPAAVAAVKTPAAEPLVAPAPAAVSDVAVAPSDVAAAPSGVAVAPSDVAAAPSGVAAAPSGVAAATSAVAVAPGAVVAGTVSSSSPSPLPPAAPARTEKPKAARSAPARARPAWLTVTASAPSTVLLDGAPIGKTPLEDVAIEAGIHAITFLRDGQRNTETVEIRAGEHKRIDARPPEPKQSPEPARGDGLDEAAVQRIVRRHGSEVREGCWQPFSTQLPGGTSVRVTATLAVEPSGRVRSVVTNGAPAAYAELSRCIEERVSNWRFPSAPGETVVNVPFVFVTE